jgi:hypothetical protein
MCYFWQVRIVKRYFPKKPTLAKIVPSIPIHNVSCPLKKEYESTVRTQVAKKTAKKSFFVPV